MSTKACNCGAVYDRRDSVPASGHFACEVCHLRDALLRFTFFGIALLAAVLVGFTIL
jgi:hypothetical protein